MELRPGKIGYFQERLITADYPRTAGAFVELLKDGEQMPRLVQHAVDAAAPYLTVPSHVMVNPAGEFQGVNYDHCVLGLRASSRLLPYLSPQHQMLSMAQAIWYMPQGLDVWDQLLCQFPGHYARDDKKCGQRPGGTDEAGNDRFDGPAWSAPTQWFQTDHEPDREGSLEQRLQRLQTRIMEGDKQGAYKVALGLHAEPGETARRALESQLLFCAIIDLQDTLQQRKLQNIGHKALRARALVSLARLVGWEQAQPLLYCVVPDIACFPRLYPLFDLSTQVLGGRFKNDLYTLKARNRSAMSPPEREALIETILNGTAEGITRHLTELLGAGKRLIAISDTVIAAYCRHINQEVWSRRSFFQIGHAYDYTNVVNFWLRNYDHPHQAKAVYFQAHFVHDCIRLTKAFPRNPESPDYLGDPATFRGWADGLSTGILLQQLLGAIEGLDCARAVALTESYLGRTRQRKPLLRALALAASKFQNDPHIQRNGATSIEEWELTTAREERDNILRAWTKYVAGGVKRTTALDCVEQYERIMGVGTEGTAVASRASMGLERGVMGTHTAQEAAALSND
ncbi:MAG TPA: hypothetical protein VH257_14650 [Chloroflexota bacterium]|nr:hypothetical protein [Chloroflexota bacterium]